MDFLTHPVLFHVGTLNGCEFRELRPHQSQQLLKAECESNTWSANTPKSYLSQRSHPSDFQESVVARSRITIYHFQVILLFFRLVKSVQCAVYCLNDRNMPLSSNKNFSASFFLPAQYPDVGPFNYRYCGGGGSGAGACASCLPVCVCVCVRARARVGKMPRGGEQRAQMETVERLASVSGLMLPWLLPSGQVPLSGNPGHPSGLECRAPRSDR